MDIFRQVAMEVTAYDFYSFIHIFVYMASHFPSSVLIKTRHHVYTTRQVNRTKSCRIKGRSHLL